MNNEKTFNSLHLSDLDLLREADGELTSFQARQVREHLAVCWTCRARRARIETAIADFVDLYHQQAEAVIPSGDEPDRQLKARLAVAHQETLLTSAKKKSLVPIRISAMVAAAALVLLLAFAWQSPAIRHRTSLVRSADLVPETQITSGMIAPVTREYVCRMESADPSPISEAIARQVFARYGLQHPAPGLYEIDYVVPPALGGKQTIANLWPQSYNHGEWNSHVKDALEERLESMVCSGQLDVRQAQHDLANNWIAAYKVYFRSEKPLLEHLAFVKDPSWPSREEDRR